MHYYNQKLLSDDYKLLLAICHSLSVTWYLLLLSGTCKNLFPFARCCTSRNTEIAWLGEGLDLGLSKKSIWQLFVDPYHTEFVSWREHLVSSSMFGQGGRVVSKKMEDSNCFLNPSLSSLTVFFLFQIKIMLIK